MGDTLYKQEAVHSTTELLQDPEWAKTICLYHRQLNNGEYPPSYVDIIFEKFRYPPDIYDAMSFAQVHTVIQTGGVAIFQIPIGVTPCADERIEEMNRLLDGLSYPFSAEFWGGTADCDGELVWERPINALLQHDGGVGFVIVPPGQARLEVGYNSAHKMCFVVNQKIPVARWPYGQSNITVLVPAWEYRCKDDSDFSALQENVWGDFATLPNPYEESWNRWGKEPIK